jgi:hypothetical protein
VAAALTNLARPHLLLAGAPDIDRLLATHWFPRATQVRVGVRSSPFNSTFSA